MSINVWISQPAALKAEVEAIKLEASPVAELVEGKIKEEVAKIVPVEIKGTALEKGGATILWAWHWSGEQVSGYPPHADIGKYMPPRYETDENGNTTEIVDETLRDVVLVWGQSPRQFA